MELSTETVTFRDGTTLTVMEANWAVSIKLTDLEEQARQNPHPDAVTQKLKSNVYPKLAACSLGEHIPTLEETAAMPSRELDKWFLAVKRMNPDWFEMADAAVNTEEVVKKKSETPTPSTPG